MNIDIVIIGRNCEKHLAECIQSVLDAEWSFGTKNIWYIDGHSSDYSFLLANSFPIISEKLEHPIPSASLGRNQGGLKGSSDIIQFVDSDVIIDKYWLENGYRVMISDERIVAVRGYLKERYPKKNLYHFSASLEWDEKVGDCEEIGGIVMIKRVSWLNAGLYPTINTGEDPALGRELLKNGGKIKQLDDNMGTHDINISNMKEWFTRSLRSGETYFSIGLKQCFKGDSFWIKEQLRIVIRGFIPIILICIAPFFNPLFLILSALLILQPTITSIPLFMKRFKISFVYAFYYSILCSFVIIPQGLGGIRHMLKRII